MTQQKNRELIIQNDSIMSVNIALTDSVKKTNLSAFPKKNSSLVLKED